MGDVRRSHWGLSGVASTRGRDITDGLGPGAVVDSLPSTDTADPDFLRLERDYRQETELEPHPTLAARHSCVMALRTDSDIVFLGVDLSDFGGTAELERDEEAHPMQHSVG